MESSDSFDEDKISFFSKVFLLEDDLILKAFGLFISIRIYE